MSASPQATSPLAGLATALPGLPGGAAWAEWRRSALERLLAAGFPTPRDEPWKYVNTRLLGRRDLAPAPPRPLPTDSLAAAPAPAALFPRFVFVDGRFNAALSHPLGSGELPLSRFGERLEASTPGSLALPLAGDPQDVDERIRTLNACLAADGPVIVVPAGSRIATHLHVVHLATGGGAYPRTQIIVGAGSALNVVETHLSLGDAEAFVAAATDIRLGESANLTHTSLQIHGARSVLFDDVAVSVAANARYQHRLAALGGQLGRVDLRVALEAPGARAELAGLIFADGGREQHVRTLVEHRAGRTQSDQLYRGVAAERGRGSYDGRVVVHPGAAKTESRQSSRNLLLGRDAAFESRPQLEINADDVKCSHGATTGTLDEQMLFYLLTRGLERDTAKALLTYAFVRDVLRRVQPASVERAAEQRVLGRLPAAELLKEFVA